MAASYSMPLHVYHSFENEHKGEIKGRIEGHSI